MTYCGYGRKRKIDGAGHEGTRTPVFRLTHQHFYNHSPVYTLPAGTGAQLTEVVSWSIIVCTATLTIMSADYTYVTRDGAIGIARRPRERLLNQLSSLHLAVVEARQDGISFVHSGRHELSIRVSLYFLTADFTWPTIIHGLSCLTYLTKSKPSMPITTAGRKSGPG